MARQKKEVTEYQEAISKIASDTGISELGVSYVIRKWMSEISYCMKQGFPVNINGLGKFSPNQKRANFNIRKKRKVLELYRKRLYARQAKYRKKIKDLQ